MNRPLLRFRGRFPGRFLALVALLAGVPLALAGCEADDPRAAVDAAVDRGPTVTWHADLKPIIDRRCNACHATGGAAPFALDTHEAMRGLAGAALAEIEAGRMPPWTPDPACRHYLDERLMPTSEVDVLRAWIAAGTPAGDPATAPPSAPATGPTFEPTLIAAPAAAYTPSVGSSDDYRCFILDAEFPRDAWLTASRLVPDAGAIVHHALVYAMEPDAIEALQAADGADGAPGYPCFGGPLPGASFDDGLGGEGSGSGSARPSALPVQIGAWAPGAEALVYPAGHGVALKAGTRIVMQVHYSLLIAPPEPDATVFEMRLTETAPEYLVSIRPLSILSLEIPAGEAHAENVRTYRNYGDRPITLIGIAGHMHLLGARIHAVVERAGGGEECLLDIPRWDFDWQQNYRLPEPVEIAPGDAIRMGCTYDNSPGNQAMVDGVRRESVDVTWGEGTFDEMCILYLTMVQPYAPPLAPGCGPATACLERCAAEGISTADCLVACPMRVICKVCALSEVIGCGGIRCAGDLFALQSEPCLEDCVINTIMLGGDMAACLRDACRETYEAAVTCLGPVLDGEACHTTMAEKCGIVMRDRGAQ